MTAWTATTERRHLHRIVYRVRNVFIIIGLLFFIVTITIIFFLAKKHPKKTGSSPIRAREILETGTKAYERKDFLTDRERKFFVQLKNDLTDEYHLLAQVRVVDVIKPNSTFPEKSKQYFALFKQISQWHIDYAIMNSQNFEIVAAIELDDTTHRKLKRKQRDKTLNEAMKQADVLMFRTMSYEDLRQQIMENSELSNTLKKS